MSRIEKENEARTRTSQPVVPPIVLSSTFAFESSADEAAAAQNRAPHIYTRWGNPTLDVVESRLAELESADWGLVFGSGMGAISTVLLHAARGANTILVQSPVYGGTHEVVEQLLSQLDITVIRADVSQLVARATELGPSSVVYAEVPANPTNRVVDLEALRAAAPQSTLIVDATFATPVNLRALDLGLDLVVHSATKYLAGHHDVLAGAVCGRDPELRYGVWFMRKLLGSVLDPAAAYRLWRGMETLELRVERQNATAADLAQRLEEHPAVEQVHYPTLPSHPDHAVATRLMSGFGGVVSFEVAPSRAQAVSDRLQRFTHAPSLGGTCSLVSWPAGVSHLNVSPEERAKSGVSDGLLRLALGLENADELWSDLAQALEAAP